MNTQEKVNHPKHYGGDTKYEAIKVIRNWRLGFSSGNALKYICRAKHKGTELLDLEKARWYLEEVIEYMHSSKEGAMYGRDPEDSVDIAPNTFTAEEVANAWKLPRLLTLVISDIHDGCISQTTLFVMDTYIAALRDG